MRPGRHLPFALTGGLLSCNPHAVEQVTLRSPVGNLNITRKTTGATVAHQPSDATRLPDTGTKAAAPGRDPARTPPSSRNSTSSSMSFRSAGARYGRRRAYADQGAALPPSQSDSPRRSRYATAPAWRRQREA